MLLPCLHLFIGLQSTLRYTTARKCSIGKQSSLFFTYLGGALRAQQHLIVSPLLPVCSFLPPLRLISRFRLASATSLIHVFTLCNGIKSVWPLRPSLHPEPCVRRQSEGWNGKIPFHVLGWQHPASCRPWQEDLALICSHYWETSEAQGWWLHYYDRMRCMRVCTGYVVRCSSPFARVPKKYRK